MCLSSLDYISYLLNGGQFYDKGATYQRGNDRLLRC